MVIPGKQIHRWFSFSTLDLLIVLTSLYHFWETLRKLQWKRAMSDFFQVIWAPRQKRPTWHSFTRGFYNLEKLYYLHNRRCIFLRADQNIRGIQGYDSNAKILISTKAHSLTQMLTYAQIYISAQAHMWACSHTRVYTAACISIHTQLHIYAHCHMYTYAVTPMHVCKQSHTQWHRRVHTRVFLSGCIRKLHKILRELLPDAITACSLPGSGTADHSHGTRNWLLCSREQALAVPWLHLSGMVLPPLSNSLLEMSGLICGDLC